jgi:hypothetical protein
MSRASDFLSKSNLCMETKDDTEYVNFGDVVARGRLHQQCQYASRYIDGRIPGYPDLGHGLRFKGDTSNYHSYRIHKDDVEEFVKRVEDYRERNGIG